MILSNPLLDGITRVHERIGALTEGARAFYYLVVLSQHDCPACGGSLKMIAPSQCRCVQCGAALDPTVTFQRSPCCSARLRRVRCHYVCARCHAIIPSRYLFDERLFNNAYHAEKMAESRARKRQQREEIRRWLAANRSENLVLDNLPALASIPGLIESLDEFAGRRVEENMADFLDADEFHMETYRQVILAALQNRSMSFHAFQSLNTDPRKERVRRFITLVFMEQAREVWLRQDDIDIMVTSYAAYDQG